MTDVHDCAVIATAGIAKCEQIVATLGSHVAQSYGSELPNSRSAQISLQRWRSHDNPSMTRS